MTLKLNGSSSGHVNLDAKAAAASNTLTLPDTTGGELVALESNGDLNIDSNTLFVDASANKVGIGTTSPNAPIEITNTSVAQLRTGYNATKYGNIGRKSNGDYEFASYENGSNIVFGTGTSDGSTTERIRVNSAGDIWINQTTNGGWGSTGAGVVHIRGNDTSNGLLRINDTGGSSDQAFIRFQYNDHGNNCGGIRRNGTGTDPEFFTGSDRRIKTNIADIPNVLDKINQVKIKTWELKSDSNTKGISPIAQDLATIFPDKVTKTDDGTGDTVPDGVEPWSIGLNYTWELIKAVQELSAKVETLETKVAALEGS